MTAHLSLSGLPGATTKSQFGAVLPQSIRDLIGPLPRQSQGGTDHFVAGAGRESLIDRLGLVRAGGDGSLQLPNGLPVSSGPGLFLEPGGFSPGSATLGLGRENAAVEPLESPERSISRDPNLLPDLGKRESFAFQLQ